MRTRFRPLLAALLAAGLLASCGTSDDGGAGGAAAVVNGTEIPREQLEQAVRELLPDLDDLDADQRGAQVGNAQRALLSHLITGVIVEQLAADRGIEVTDADVAAYREVLVAEIGGEEGLREAAAARRIPPTMLEEEYIPREATVLALLRDLAGDDVAELRTVRHILLDTEEEAQEALDDLAAGADFAELATEISLDVGSAADGGMLPPAGPGQYAAGFEEAVWEAPEGELVGPVESQFGWHVLEVVEIDQSPASEAPLMYVSQRYSPELNVLVQERYEDADVTIASGLGRWSPEQGVIAAAVAGTPLRPGR